MIERKIKIKGRSKKQANRPTITVGKSTMKAGRYGGLREKERELVGREGEREEGWVGRKKREMREEGEGTKGERKEGSQEEKDSKENGNTKGEGGGGGMEKQTNRQDKKEMGFAQQYT